MEEAGQEQEYNSLSRELGREQGGRRAKAADKQDRQGSEVLCSDKSQHVQRIISC